MQRSLWKFTLVILLGALVGSVVSKVIGLFVQPGTVVSKLFVEMYQPIGPEIITLNMGVIQLTFGLTLQVNLMSVIGIFIAAQLLRWYR
jgi:hypothetical protein